MFFNAGIIHIIITYGILFVIGVHAGVILWTSRRELNKMYKQTSIVEDLRGSDNYPHETFRICKQYNRRILKLRSKKAFFGGMILACILLSHGDATLWNVTTNEGLIAFVTLNFMPHRSKSWFYIHIGNFLFSFYYTILERGLLFSSELEEFEIEKYFGFTRTSKHKWIQNFFAMSGLKVIFWPLYLEAYIWGLQLVDRQIADNNWMVLLLMCIVYFLVFPNLFVIIGLSNKKKVKPLPDGELKTRIERLAERVRYPKENIFMLSSTKAMHHPNAFHVRFPGYDRLIIFESLMKQRNQTNDAATNVLRKGLSDPQVETVVAHELGHSHFSHGTYGVVYLQLKTLFSCWLSMSLIKYVPFYKAMGFVGIDQLSDLYFPGLIASDLFVTQNILSFIDFLFAFFQRHWENKADEFAVRLGYGHMLESALVKIAADNLTFPDDDYFYTAVNCSSHPSIITRVKNIRKLMYNQ